MTFCGDLPFVPSGINHHPFENLRRGQRQPQPETTVRGQTTKVFAGFWAKTFVGCAFHPWTGGDGCGCLCPRRQGLKRVQGTGYNNGQAPAATTKSACAKRRCPSHPGGLLPGCRERRSRRDRGGATGTVAASQGVWRQGWKPARAETASLAPFTTARPARGTPGKGISRRTTKQTVMRASEKRRTVAVAVAVAVAGTTTSSVTGK